MAFAEVMDAVERESKLIIISSNLNGKEIENRYGTRTFERIISTTKRIEFRGESFRVWLFYPIIKSGEDREKITWKLKDKKWQYIDGWSIHILSELGIKL